MPDNVIDNMSIDCVVFGFSSELKVLLVKHADGLSKGRWALPGGWITEDESLDQAASRILYLLTGVKDLYLDQLKAYGDVNRFPTKRVLTVAYYSLIKDTDYKLSPGFTASDAKWFTPDEIVDLPYDHHEILKDAFSRLQSRVKQEPIGFNLLPEKFTLGQLQTLYESILRIQLDKPNFRRKMLKMNFLIDCNEKQEDVSHRAAKLYKFDKPTYEQLREKKFVLDL